MSIKNWHSEFRVVAGPLQRVVDLSGGHLLTRSLTVRGREILSQSAECSFTITFASPNQKPQGLRSGEGGTIEATAVQGQTDTLALREGLSQNHETVRWVDPISVSGTQWGQYFDKQHSSILYKDGIHRLTIMGKSESITCSVFYEAYDTYPVVRKWMQFTNRCARWLKLQDLKIEDWVFADDFRHSQPLTPAERGANASVIAMGPLDGSFGIILGSEIPSALRDIQETGSMSYRDDYFEWVLGPGEIFTSEPVFEYAYAGTVVRTLSGYSRPLDRELEGHFKNFLRERIGVLVRPKNLPAPYFSTWTNFGPHINDEAIRRLANSAARAGFELFEIDEGWGRGLLGTEPDLQKFPDFEATCRFVRSHGLRLGLWTSSFRQKDSKDWKEVPNSQSLPPRKRMDAFGMSFASRWREYYARDLIGLHQRFGATYFKQDLTNIRFGDFAEGHESRTWKESLLRGLRGLLEAQDLIRQTASEIALELTHEIYWGTPGVPCDLAVLKHAHLYHIPPNDYSGTGVRTEPYSEAWNLDPVALERSLLEGCFHARQRLFAHRGLPLEALEYYGAATVSFKGSLTPQIQDRQICSWLMGAPMVFAGDLASLTDNHLDHYADRFKLVKRLEETYHIYGHFQFSGVPEPTDDDWHWWGKLNEAGCGVVVVIRGGRGQNARSINVPWTRAESEYRVTAALQGRPLGEFSGKQLQGGAVELDLPVYGQEILELSSNRRS